MPEKETRESPVELKYILLGVVAGAIVNTLISLSIVGSFVVADVVGGFVVLYSIKKFSGTKQKLSFGLASTSGAAAGAVGTLMLAGILLVVSTLFGATTGGLSSGVYFGFVGGLCLLPVVLIGIIWKAFLSSIASVWANGQDSNDQK